MPNTNWSKLNNMQLGRYAEYYAKMEFASYMQLGRYAEYYAKMEFASYGFEVYTSEVDDHGIDFIAKTKEGRFLEIQVKSIRQTNYVFMQKTKWNIDSSNTFLSLLLFEDARLPEIYLIPATAWKNPSDLLCDKDYKGLKRKPEYGLNISKKNMPLLQLYKFEKVIISLLDDERSMEVHNG